MTNRATRRLRTIPTYLILFGLMLVLAPILLPLVAGLDAIRWAVQRRPLMASRLYLFGLVYLGSEVAGLILLAAAWIGASFGRAEGRLLAWTFAIQQAWAGTLLGAARAIFGLTFHVEGEERIPPGPIMLMVRHASIVDNLLPSAFVARPFDIRLRYVLKLELLSDPCLDVAGNRLPNYFVERGSDDTEGELTAIRRLAGELGPRDGVLIYPEGTRFTEAKQARALERLEQSDPELYERARSLRHVLPPRLGGSLALLEATDPADVIVLIHHGLDGFAHLRDIWAGGMVDTTIEVEFWRIARAQIPEDRDARVAWLYDLWQRVDGWIDEASRRREGAS